jgi:hypothetical protein
MALKFEPADPPPSFAAEAMLTLFAGFFWCAGALCLFFAADCLVAWAGR